MKLSNRFVVPMRDEKVVRALYELRGRAGCPQLADVRRGEDTAPYSIGFMVPIRGQKTMETPEPFVQGAASPNGPPPLQPPLSPAYVAMAAFLRKSSRFSLPLAKASRSEEHTSELQSHHDLVC